MFGFQVKSIISSNFSIIESGNSEYTATGTSYYLENVTSFEGRSGYFIVLKLQNGANIDIELDSMTTQGAIYDSENGRLMVQLTDGSMNQRFGITMKHGEEIVKSIYFNVGSVVQSPIPQLPNVSIASQDAICWGLPVSSFVGVDMAVVRDGANYKVSGTAKAMYEGGDQWAEPGGPDSSYAYIPMVVSSSDENTIHQIQSYGGRFWDTDTPNLYVWMLDPRHYGEMGTDISIKIDFTFDETPVKLRTFINTSGITLLDT